MLERFTQAPARYSLTSSCFPRPGITHDDDPEGFSQQQLGVFGVRGFRSRQLGTGNPK